MYYDNQPYYQREFDGGSLNGYTAFRQVISMKLKETHNDRKVPLAVIGDAWKKGVPAYVKDIYTSIAEALQRSKNTKLETLHKKWNKDLKTKSNDTLRDLFGKYNKSPNSYEQFNIDTFAYILNFIGTPAVSTVIDIPPEMPDVLSSGDIANMLDDTAKHMYEVDTHLSDIVKTIATLSGELEKIRLDLDKRNDGFTAFSERLKHPKISVASIPSTSSVPSAAQMV